MGSIFFIIFIIMMFGNTKGDNRRSELFRFLIIGSIIMSGISIIIEPLGVIAVIAMIIWLISWRKKKKNSNNRKEQYGWDPQRWDREQGNQNTYQESKQEKASAKRTVLPQASAKRKKIVTAFNEKYQLCLTAEQVQGIVNSTYMSEIWRKEVEAMNRKYENVYEWFQGYTKWLRVYLYVFHVQEVTSDIRQQENICMYAFEEVFRYVDEFSELPLHEKIRRVNEKFYTSFDDVSFMIAYRFLESKGRSHDLGTADLVREDENLDDLLKKYQTAEGNDMSGQSS